MFKVYMINMDRNPERLAFMRSNFDRLGISFERFPAVDGRKLGDAAFERFKSTRPLRNSGDSYAPRGRQWTPSKMGCFLSHHSLWTIAANSPDRFTAIFEDDVHVAPALKHFLANDHWIPEGCDIIRFEASYNRIRLAHRPLAQMAGRTLYRVVTSQFEHCWPIGNGGYIISREGARKLIDVPEHLHCASDIFVFNKHESPVAATIAACQLAPALCIQDKFLHRSQGAIVYKSEIDLTPPPELKESQVKSIQRKMRTAGLIILGYRRVNFRDSSARA